jgi:hypothetical protein
VTEAVETETMAATKAETTAENLLVNFVHLLKKNRMQRRRSVVVQRRIEVR